MANPFLMLDDEVGDAGNDSACNPFLIQEAQTDEEFPDNPFMAQGTNPFAAFGEEETSVVSEAIVPSNDAAMSFFGTTINETDEEAPPGFDNNKLPNPLANFDEGMSGYSSEDELVRKKVPPRPLPPSQTTQDLIFAVSDQLDQASSQMLGRLPKTRTPSPVSMRDFHSPSPTPDSALADFLDYEDTQQSNIFEQDLMGGNDNPFAPTSVPVMQAAAPVQPIVKPQPPRPPPPRPVPPRPSPPAIPTAPHTHAAHQAPAQVQQNQEPDLFDMFGDSSVPPPKPPAPKTTEDILSLFGAPKPVQQQQQAQPDFLSGDILDDIPSEDGALPAPFSETATQSMIPPAVPNSFPNSDSQPTISEPQQAALEQCTEEPVEPTDEPQKPVMDSIIPEVYKRAPTPDIEITTVESLPRSDDEEEPQPEIEKDPEPEPEVESELEKSEMEPVMDESDYSQATESNITTQATPGSPMEVNVIEQIGEHEQMDTGLDFAPSIPSGSASANPFASPETEDVYPIVQHNVATNIFAVEEPIDHQATNIFSVVESAVQHQATNIFAVEESAVQDPATNIFAVEEPTSNMFETEEAVLQPSAFVDSFAVNPMVAQPVTPIPSMFGLDEDTKSGGGSKDAFDAFSAKFDSARKEDISLLDGFGGTTPVSGGDAWGEADDFGVQAASGDGFGGEEGFDSFLALQAPERPAFSRKDSNDSLNENEKEFSVVIRPKGDMAQGIAPVLAPPPPPRGGSQNNSIYSGDSSPRFNPFDKSDEVASADGVPSIPEPAAMTRTDSQETPTTPLFDDDVSQPLEDFPRITYAGTGWEMQLRQPNKKKITGQRFWKKIFVKVVFQGDNPVVQLYNQSTDKEPFQELPLQPCYSVSEIGAQQYDQFGKIFTIKLQYIFYKERPGVRPGQVTKAERLTNKLSQFAAYAIQGDYQGVKEFGSDLKKLGLPVEHAPQVSQLFKIGSMSFEDMKQFSVTVEEALFKLTAHRDRALNYKSEEVQITAVDELYAEQDSEGHVHKQIARVRLFFLGFLSGMPSIELGVNDLWRQGKEVVGRHDIIPVVTEEWIRLEGVEFHNTVQQDEYERSRTIKFQPPDACYIELMRFRVRPPKNRELPLQLKASWCVTGNRVELRADVLVPGFASRKLGQIPCEDVAIRFPIPECWIYLFRVEKHFRYGSVKSAHRRTGKIKGIERILGAVDTLQESLIEVTSGQAKYEHHHRAIVWRCPRLPKEGQGAYTTHQMVCRMALTSYDQIPEQLAPYCYVEFTMPATQVSHTTVRSVSVQESDSDEPPEKYVRYLARHEYRVGIEATTGETQNAYLTATRATIKEEAPQQPPATSPMAPSDSDSESN